MKRKTWKLAPILLAGCMLVGCGSGQADSGTASDAPAQEPATEAAADSGSSDSADSGEVVTITFWDENAGDGRSEVYEEMIKRFEEENPNIHIEYLGLTQTEASAKYQTTIQGDSLPDVGGTVDDWTAAIVQQDVCVPLDDYFASSGLDQVYNQGVLDIAKTYHPDGKIYYVPKTANINGFWINTQMFKEAGLEAPKTWDDVFTDIETLTDAKNGVYGFVIRGGGTSASEFITLMYSYSGIDSIYKDGKCTINAPEHVEFMQKMKDIYGVYTAESDITAGYKELVAAFDSGSAAMIYHNLGSYATHMEAFGDPSAFEFVPYPDGLNGNYTYDGSATSGLLMFNSCEHPDEAWKWIEYILSHEGNSYWNEKAGQIPVNTECMDDAWLQDAPHIKAALEVMNKSNAVAVSKPEYLPGYANILSTDLEPAVQSLLSGDITAQEFIDMCEEDLNTEYEAYHQ